MDKQSGFHYSNLQDNNFFISKKIEQSPNLLALQLTRNIATELLVIKINSIFNIIEQKLLNQQMKAFMKMKKCQNPKVNAAIYLQQQMAVMNQFTSKISNIKSRMEIKVYAQVWTELMRHKIHTNSNSKSIIQQRRLGSRIEPDKSKYQEDGTKRQNQFLKKKKDKMKNNLQDFYSKIDKLLITHENHLKK